MRVIRLPILLLVLLLVPSFAHADDFAFVRNASNPTDKLSKTEVRDMLGGKRIQWPSNKQVLLVIMGEGSPSLEWAASTFFGVSSQILMTKIRQKVFQNEMPKPITVGSEQEVFDRVKATAGALGIVGASAAKTPPGGVAAVQVSP